MKKKSTRKAPSARRKPLTPEQAADQKRRAQIREITANMLAVQDNPIALTLLQSWTRLLRGLAVVMPADSKKGGTR